MFSEGYRSGLLVENALRSTSNIKNVAEDCSKPKFDQQAFICLK